jgi:hypothetical protein
MIDGVCPLLVEADIAARFHNPAILAHRCRRGASTPSLTLVGPLVHVYIFRAITRNHSVDNIIRTAMSCRSYFRRRELRRRCRWGNLLSQVWAKTFFAVARST